jgi:hypothetical protein
MALSVGQRVTLLRIDDCLAMTHRYELDVRSVLHPHAVGYQNTKWHVAAVRQRGKRKDFYLDLAADDILLDGWGCHSIRQRFQRRTGWRQRRHGGTGSDYFFTPFGKAQLYPGQ